MKLQEFFWKRGDFFLAVRILGILLGCLIMSSAFLVNMTASDARHVDITGFAYWQIVLGTLAFCVPLFYPWSFGFRHPVPWGMLVGILFLDTLWFGWISVKAFFIQPHTELFQQICGGTVISLTLLPLIGQLLIAFYYRPFRPKPVQS